MDKNCNILWHILYHFQLIKASRDIKWVIQWPSVSFYCKYNVTHRDISLRHLPLSFILPPHHHSERDDKIGKQNKTKQKKLLNAHWEQKHFKFIGSQQKQSTFILELWWKIKYSKHKCVSLAKLYRGIIQNGIVWSDETRWFLTANTPGGSGMTQRRTWGNLPHARC